MDELLGGADPPPGSAAPCASTRNTATDPNAPSTSSAGPPQAGDITTRAATAGRAAAGRAAPSGRAAAARSSRAVSAAGARAAAAARSGGSAAGDAADQLDVLLQAVEEASADPPEDLEGCEKLITGSSLKNNFLRIGQALITIHDRKLFKRAGGTSFTQYIEQKGDFGFGPRQALRLLSATRLVRAFPPNIPLPISERQVKAATYMEACRAVRAWLVPQRACHSTPCTCPPVPTSCSSVRASALPALLSLTTADVMTCALTSCLQVRPLVTLNQQDAIKAWIKAVAVAQVPT
jgi:hypothetical protein